MDPTLQTIAVLLMASLPIYVYSYPDGKVTDSCVTMIPEHGVQAQTSSPPYTLSLDKYTYSAGDKIKVTLSSSSSATQFRGFLIQARSGSSTTPVGSFLTTNSNTQTLTCTSAASSVSHTSSTANANIEVTWVAPASSTADIQIRAAVVQTEYVFWTNVLSTKITYVAFNNTSSTTLVNSSSTNTTAASSTTVVNSLSTNTTAASSTTVVNSSSTNTTAASSTKVENSSSTNTTAASSTTVINSSSANTTAASKPSVSNNGVQHTWTLGGLLFSCGAVIASLLA